MAYLDEPENDGHERDARGVDRRGPSGYDDDQRPTAAPPSKSARPAWDAATYGTPDDMHRLHTQTHRRGDPPELYRSDAETISDTYRDLYRTERSTGIEPEPGHPAPDPPAWSPARGQPRRGPSSGSSQDSPASGWPQGYPTGTQPTITPQVRSATTEYRLAGYPYPARRYSVDSYPGGLIADGGDTGTLARTDDTQVSPRQPGSTRGDHRRGGADDLRSGGGEQLRRDGEHTQDRGAHHQEAEPGEAVAADGAGQTAGRSRAGRNLPAAIAVGLLLGAIAVGSLVFWRPAFLGVLAATVGLGTWEMVRAIRSTGVNPPLVPLVIGGGLMMGLAWWGHADALTFGLIVTVVAVMVWRLADGVRGYGRDISAASWVAVYIPFLGGFTALLATPADGDLRVLVLLAGVVLSDTGGYVAGVLFGRHPMAPSVSPKKSWEGLAGSMVAAAVGGALLLFFLFGVAWGWGALFGLTIACAAVVGDLGESMIKRDLGVKDMSQLLPGHGGLMDRLDSIVLAAPVAYLLLVLLAPPL